MKIQHFRNATMVIEADDKVILVDPMLGPKSTMPPFSFIRFKAKKNPLVELPAACLPILDKVTHCLITHLHPDHLDKDGEQFLRENNTPVICSVLDEKELRKRGLNVVQTIDYWKRVDFLGGKIEGIPAVHGYGFVAKPAGNVMGYYIELPDQPSIYLSSDTIYTEHVDKVLKEYNPDLSVCASGSAQFDIFKPLLMHMDDIVRFTQNAPNKVLHNHMEAVNHCPTTRADLKRELQSKGLLDKVFIPQDGEWINL
ncbi:MBL fold metallo-hydrolase [Flammeovirga yaeyamensis]|uniref:MBL fold metallo-hydrolase n=1 Tax=Flammeovirga yaeyamensis TaxID=367791 RepID=A0AAX1NE25_9BACT|nr:MBL fold metallo-hydrolase [Flammeovirga yaeyamensis]MBB3697256.1 L-ascorbate metabolism protein UlaG (beta-lactamase superfamily) [Flammeovirga yaeyamensis]NMF33914.1 MBL fold metallo-hydrolase [Flammeovirga yaeyamensis]QWG04826.1 MBL fold metallo-hydrolase [Flammeovirga yaeyamensis]